MTISKSFTAVGVSDILSIAPGQSADVDVSGTYTGVIAIEVSDSPNQYFKNLYSGSSAAAYTRRVTNETKGSMFVRLHATPLSAGTAVCTLAEAPDAQKRITNAAGQAKAGTTSGWIVAVGDNIALVTCPASKTGSTLVVPITGLKVGEVITAFHLIGQIESGGNHATVDAALRKHTAAAADVADASVAAITQLDVVADTIMSESNTRKTLTEVVGVDETFYVLITVTTGAATDIALQGVAIETTGG